VARGGGRPTRRWVDGDGLKRGDHDAHLAGNSERNDYTTVVWITWQRPREGSVLSQWATVVFLFFLIIIVGRARGDHHFHCRFKTDGDEVRYQRSLSPAKGQNQ
jgi:hypothetical protein